MTGTIVKHSVRIAGHQTSISLEQKFWTILQEIALRENVSINKLITNIDATRSGNMSSTLRLFVLEDLERRLSSNMD
ncbi:ribbon-helix-helix domain-containing protein [Sneathiella marina]|uniref:Ribbon-helix-helix domain-containing protein n=1 Tax=Sneathiella marina TaxID=2950108 RepID=A0ABY4W0X6_9PROT|nr:ribbon-helix-helix domain-containing protein [Sneathiella marina]USG60609.1 ribbon-helix-helix domain-containing protein [Sneathiella marina]